MSPTKISLALLVLFVGGPASAASDFESSWHTAPDRRFVGPELWANRLQDWRVVDGRLECERGEYRLPMRTVHVLTHDVDPGRGGFELRAHVHLIPERQVNPDAAVGFLIGVGDGVMDYRSAALVQAWPGRGAGYFVGITADEKLVSWDNSRPAQKAKSEMPWPSGLDDLSTDGVEFVVKGEDRGDGQYLLKVQARDPREHGVVAEHQLVLRTREVYGGVALVSHPGPKTEEHAPGRFAFHNVVLSGPDVVYHEGRTFGPIAGAQYTLSRDVLKLTAQMLPLGDADPLRARLDVDVGEGWQQAAAAEIVQPGFTAPFRVEGWDATRNIPYRVVVTLNDREGRPAEHAFEGVVRREPGGEGDDSELVIAAFTGNHNNSHDIGGGWGGRRGAEKNNWVDGMWFPHADLTGRQRGLRTIPDLMFFAGDQVYEGKSPTFADRANIQLDYLYKWYLWCWAYRDLARERPCITIPDDHDVYQGNLWGENGRKIHNQDFGGYVHPAEFVRMVERTQTSHLPDPFDPTPIEQGIGVYYTDFVYGRVSFCVLEDRKFKTGPAGKDLPPTGTKRPDHVADPGYDFSSTARADLKLLGDRQLAFLEHWSADWRGADMKIALSQTTFAGMATHHGAALTYLMADLDSNGWPPHGRNAALRLLRRGLAFHIAGDQHLATLVQHGIDAHRDAIWSFCVPSVANFYPRGWWPHHDGAHRGPSAPPWTGDHVDGFGNRVTVHAATNPGGSTGREPADLHDRMAGYGIVRVDREARTVTAECWPRWANPAEDAQYPGWPRTIAQLDADGRPAAAHLPEVASKSADPIVQVEHEGTGEVLYTLRIRGDRFRPKVFDPEATYAVRVWESDDGSVRTLTGVRPD